MFLGVVACGLLHCRRSDTAAPSALKLETCRVSGIKPETMCGTLRVDENRVAPGGRKIELKLLVARAFAPDSQPDPLFILAGGPGQAATEVAEQLLPALERVRRNRDIVFVDQRGTGKSNPLDCEPNADGGLQKALESNLNPASFLSCLHNYSADTRQYTTPIAVDDLDEVRRALGYTTINLYGASYGTRVALVYLRQYPQNARTAVLDGVAPVDLPLPLSFAKDGERSMQLLLKHCEAEPSCAGAFPQLAQKLDQLLTRLEKAPWEGNLKDPLSGAPTHVRVTHHAFTSILRGLLYLPEAASLIPLIIFKASAGDFEPFAAQASALSHGFEKGLSFGMFFSVFCSEDMARISAEDIAREAKGTFLGPSLAQQLFNVCEKWPKGWLPEGYRNPVQSATPTLLLSGELDPVTPPSHAVAAAQHLTQATSISAKGLGHGVLMHGCAPKVVSEFIARGNATSLDTSCIKSIERPPFFITFAGPTP